MKARKAKIKCTAETHPTRRWTPSGEEYVGEVGWLGDVIMICQSFNGTHMSDAVHGLNLVVEASDLKCEALPVGDDELVPQGPGHQHDVVVDQAEIIQIHLKLTDGFSQYPCPLFDPLQCDHAYNMLIRSACL